MKKTLSLCLAASVLTAIVSATVTFAEDSPYISLNAEEVPEKNVVEVTARLYDNPGIAGYSIDLKFDGSAFGIGDYAVNEYFEDNGMMLENTSEEGVIRFTWSDEKDFTENGELFTVYFTTKDAIPESYKFELSYENNNIVNAQQESIQIELGNAEKGVAATDTPAPATPTPDPLDIKVTNPFKDVASDAWFNKYVMYCYANNLFKGVSTNTFEPQTKMTRAMFITVLYRLAGNNEKAVNTTAFTDVSAGSWYGDSVYWAYEKGLISGVAEKKFAPDELITREQMMVIIYNFYKGTPVEYNLTFSDSSMISNWAKDAVRFCVSKEIILGREDNTLAPTEGLTRAEAAKMFFTVATTLNNPGEPAPAESSQPASPGN